MSEEYQKISASVSDPKSENLQKLAALFPSVIKDGEVDFDALKAELGEFTEVGKEFYSLNWAGKQEAQKKTGEPIIGRTLKFIPEESKNAETTENLYIEGDNLEALKLLQNSYRGRVKMIYIDPPYNTGNDFVYNDNFRESEVSAAVAEGNAGVSMRGGELRVEKYSVNAKTSGRYHANWLSMMYPRLRLAKNLLSEDGVIFISIDDNEVANLREICDEIFGSENFIANINWKGRGGRQDSKYFAAIHEYIICYAKSSISFTSGEELVIDKGTYPKFDEIKKRNYKTQLLRKWGSNSRREDRPNLFYPILAPDNTMIYPMLSTVEEGRWRWNEKRMSDELANGNIEFVKTEDSWVPYEKIYEPQDGENKTKKYTTWIDDIQNGTDNIKSLFGTTVFDYSKSPELISRFINMSGVDPTEFIVLDFFSGSATTAHAVMQLNAEDGGNRKFILVQLPEPCDEKSEAYKAGYKNICEIGKERIRRAGEKIKSEHPEADVDVGFKVFRVEDTNIRWIAAEKGTPGVTLEDALTASSKDLRDFMKGANDLDVVYEILIRQYDIPLTASIVNLPQIGKRTYTIADTVVVCLEEEISGEIVDKIAAIEPIPQKIIFRDSAFNDDISMKENAMMRLDALMQKHASGGKQPYSVEFL